MAELGETADLKVLRERKFGLVLDSEGPLGEVLLPRAEMPGVWEVGERLKVFLYTDSDDRPVATMRRPKAVPGEFGVLKVVATTPVGAFLDWGLAKDLLLPFGEQKTRPQVGHTIVVRVEIDEESGRIIATQKLGRYLETGRPPFVAGDKVEALVYARTDLGFKVIINDRFGALLYKNEVFRKLRPGERLHAYVSLVRPDGKIDVSLYAPGRKKVSNLEAELLSYLDRCGGFSPLSDNSPAEEIHAELGVSKKSFKQAVGALFKKRKIDVSDDGIRLLEEGDWSPGE